MKKLLVSLTFVLMLFVSAFASEDSSLAPSGILVSDDNLIFTDTFGHAIWQLDSDGVYTKLAGREAVVGANNIPLGAYHDDDALDAAFDTPWAIAVFGDGYAITDSANNVIRYLADGKVTTLAGSGSAGSKNATGTKATFSRPTGIVSDDNGGLYVADSDNHLIRHISKTGVVTTYAGSSEGMSDGALRSAQFSDPTGLAYADGVLYVADTGNHRICKIVDGEVITVVGGVDGYEDGGVDVAMLSSPMGIAILDDALYIADTGNGAIRYISDDYVSTLVYARNEQIFPISPRGLAILGDKLWICDPFSLTLASVSSEIQLFEDVSAEDYVTRAMFTEALYTSCGAVPANYIMPFTDVAADSEYAEAVRWASSIGVVNGTGEDSFSPDDFISCQQIAVMLYRYAQFIGSAEAVSDYTDIAEFDDFADIADYALEASQWVYELGIIDTADNLLKPTEFVNASAATSMLLEVMSPS